MYIIVYCTNFLWKGKILCDVPTECKLSGTIISLNEDFYVLLSE